MNRRIYFDHGIGCSCGGCAGGNPNSYNEQFRGPQGIQGPIGPQGPSGKNSLLVGSDTDGTTDTDGVDVGIDTGVIAALQAEGFDPTQDPTLRFTPDPTDQLNNKVFGRFSNGWFNWFVPRILQRTLPPAGNAGTILQSDGTNWVPTNKTYEIYNTTSATSFAIDQTLPGTSKQFVVDKGLAYRIGQQVWAVKFDGGVLDPANYIIGVVTAYVSGTSTGTLTVLVSSAYGSASPAQWYIGLGSPVQLPNFNSPSTYGQYVLNNNGTPAFGNPVATVGSTEIWFGNPNPTGGIPKPGWLFCNGATYQKTDYPSLYDFLNWSSSPFIIDSNSFRTPNINGRALAGANGAEIAQIGSLVGNFNKTIGATDLPVTAPWQMPDHTHPFTYQSPNTNAQAGSGAAGSVHVDFGAAAGTTGGSGAQNLTTNTGGGQPFSLMQPTIGIELIIKAN